MFARVSVTLPLPPLTYRVPEGLELALGDPVAVRVRKKKMSGIVTELLDNNPEQNKFEIRDIEERCADFPSLSKETLQMLRWASEYYHYPAGEVLRAFLPPNPAPPRISKFHLSEEGLQRLKGGDAPKGKSQRALLEALRDPEGIIPSAENRATLRRMQKAGWVSETLVSLDAINPCPPPNGKLPSLTQSQAAAVNGIVEAIDSFTFKSFLLQGVTGSGKTEVYLRCAEHCLKIGRSVLVIVPEISLTPQLVGRFQTRLGESIAVLHSGMSDGERSRQWHLLNRGKLKVCIGARSAALAPIQGFGLIVVDEEHDSALKQEDHLKYNARDLAIVRAKQGGAAVVLGSATPSLETFHNAQSGRHIHLVLPERPGGRTLPEVRIIDRTKYRDPDSISAPLRQEINGALASGGQVMLLLNRRGYSSFLLCSSCGFVPECPNCSVSLTNYRSNQQMKCHYCGHQEQTHTDCKKCGTSPLQPGTLGTESLEEEAQRLFPSSRILRIDRESMERKGALELALSKISAREVDIVIGTQMIAKGHDFPNISLVGVINADSSFHLPDFRAAEKSFQLFTQMAGRAGRGERPGRVVIQTHNPNHPSIIHATKHDFRSFAEDELGHRLTFHYPPYSRMVRLLITGMSPGEAEAGANRISSAISRIQVNPGVEQLGPAPAVLSKIQNRYRWNLLLKCKEARPLHTVLDTLSASLEKILPPRVSLQVDVDPISLM